MLKVAIDLFAGTGGFSHGWIQAGGVIAVAVDVWDKALKNHEHNHPETPTLKMELGHYSIEYTAKILKRFLDCFEGEEIHIHIHGSPPCQDISNASNGDPSNGMKLVLWFLELVAYMKPDSWSMENVLPVASRLPENVPFIRVNSADYGVPQNRRRVFAGVGWSLTPTHKKENWVSVLQAIPSLEGCEFEAVPSMVNRWKNLTIKRPSPTITSQSVGQIRIKSKEGVRGISVQESSIIQGWDDLKFISTLTQSEKKIMVGNMVNPPIAKAICEGIQ